MRVLELFCGYGTASFALKRLGIPYELIGYSDIDKYANQCFKQNHCPNDINDKLRLGDCTKINPNELQDFDLLTGGFPCQAFSIAGKGLGELDTRGTLFNEIIRIAEVKQPRYMMLENVKGLMSKKHKPTFDKIISELYRIGYFVKWKVLNTKEHGIPQNRERVFFTCFRNWNDFCSFEWPEKEELKIFLKDILEDEVDEKYYLSEKQVNRLLNSDDLKKKFSYLNPEIAGCMTARQFSSWRGNFVSDIVQLNKPKHSNNRVYSPSGVSPALNTMQGGNRQPFIIDDTQGYDGFRKYKDTCPTLRSQRSGLKVFEPFIAASRGRNKENPSDRTPGNTTEQRLEPKFDGTTNTITSVQKDNYVVDLPIIRKLTPKECFRLQGFLNDEVNLDGISKTQQYKLAGNGQSINVVKKIFENMFF